MPGGFGKGAKGPGQCARGTGEGAQGVDKGGDAGETERAGGQKKKTERKKRESELEEGARRALSLRLLRFPTPGSAKYSLFLRTSRCELSLLAMCPASRRKISSTCIAAFLVYSSLQKKKRVRSRASISSSLPLSLAPCSGRDSISGPRRVQEHLEFLRSTGGAREVVPRKRREKACARTQSWTEQLAGRSFFVAALSFVKAGQENKFFYFFCFVFFSST